MQINSSINYSNSMAITPRKRPKIVTLKEYNKMTARDVAAECKVHYLTVSRVLKPIVKPVP